MAKNTQNQAFAVIRSGGKQYIVSKTDIIEVDKIGKKKGEKITFDTLLKTTPTSINIGKPSIKQGKVEGKIIDDFKDKKIKIVKFKPKKRYKKITGFRAAKTKVEITKI